MRKQETALFLTAVASTFIAVNAGAQTTPQIKEMKPGKYDYVIETNNPGLPIKIPAMNMSKCVTAKDIESGSGLQAQKDAGVNCTYSDIKSSAGQYAFKAVCQMKSGMSTIGDYDVKASDKVITMNVKQQITGGKIPPEMANSTVKITMTRSGDC